MCKIKLVVALIATLFAGSTYLQAAQDTLTVMYYNVLNFPGGTPERIANFRTTAAYLQPDILVVTELLSEDGADDLLQNGLNVYGKSNYHRADFTDGEDSDNMLFYNSDKIAFYSQDTIETELRLINEYVVYTLEDGSVAGNDTVFMRFYSAHLKASQGTDNKLKRLAEVNLFKQHVNQIPNAENIIFGGDLNLYTSTEPAYEALTTGDLFPLTDPLPAGSWHDNAGFAPWHTQSTRTDQFGGGATGGMDDRFDFILFSDDIANGNNQVSYVPGSCLAFGNDGNHFNESLLDLPLNSSLPDSVLNALYYMSDHLPVICKFAVQTNSVPEMFNLDLSVLLEGPFRDTAMSTNMNQWLPLSQPFDKPPWNYNGIESVESIGNPEIVDWVLVELRQSESGPAYATADHTIWQKACFLLSNGSITGTDQNSLPPAEVPFADDLYVVIRHRNHLDVMSANPLTLAGDTCVWHFQTGSGQAFGDISAQKEIAPGVWGMIAGDANADGQVSQDDIDSGWKADAGKPGYSHGDVNLNGEVDNRDKNAVILINFGKTSQVPF